MYQTASGACLLCKQEQSPDHPDDLEGNPSHAAKLAAGKDPSKREGVNYPEGNIHPDDPRSPSGPKPPEGNTRQ